MILFFAQGPNSIVTYKITSDDLALEYFIIDHYSGIVTLKKALADSTTTMFKVISF
jgi:hypothetical protein